MSTDKLAAAIRELVERWMGKKHPITMQSYVSDLTALISDGYVSKEAYNVIKEHYQSALAANDVEKDYIDKYYYPKDMVRWTFNQRFMACGHTGFDSSILELDLEYWNEHIKGKENER